MRVITSFGFGKTNRLPERSGETVEVALEDKKDPLGSSLTLNSGEVYPFGEDFVVRVVTVEGAGVFSNILPFVDSNAALSFYGMPAPEGETRFFLDLQSGEMRLSRPLGPMVPRYFHLQPFMDRWVTERSAVPNSHSVRSGNDRVKILAAFDEWDQEMAGTSEGIYVPSVLDLKEERILRFSVAVIAARGVVFRRHFD